MKKMNVKLDLIVSWKVNSFFSKVSYQIEDTQNLHKSVKSILQETKQKLQQPFVPSILPANKGKIKNPFNDLTKCMIVQVISTFVVQQVHRILTAEWRQSCWIQWKP